MGFLEKWQPQLLSVLRFVSGLLFLEHGTAKLLHFPHVAMFDDLKLASLLGVAGIIELVGGALVTIGLFTRYAAFLMSGEMAVAYFLFHMKQGPYPVLNGGEPAVLFCFVFLYIAAAGPGPWSVDRR
ncbi:MAG TPA: DoxX family protein [Rhizomicrobium sp.]|jgi:putative oxidoreductase